MGLGKTTPRTTTIAIASSNTSLGAFEKPVSPGFQDLPGPNRRECGDGSRKHSTWRLYTIRLILRHQAALRTQR